MGAPVTLLLVVGLGGGEVRSGQLSTTLNAQLDSSRVQVRMRRADGVPNFERVLEAASALGPVAVVTNPRRGQLKIRVALQPGQWVSRTFTFAKGDPLTERNRTVALAIAAMVPEWRLPKPLPEPEPEPEPAPAQVAPLTEAETVGPPDAGSPPVEPEPLDAGIEAPVDAEILEAGSVEVAGPIDAGPPPALEARSTEPEAIWERLGLEVAALAGFWPLAQGVQVGGNYCAGWLGGGLLLRGQRGELTEGQASLWRAGVLVTGRAQTTLGWERLRGALQLSAGPGWVMAQRREQAQSHWQLEAGLDAELSVRVFGTLWLFVRGGAGVVSGPTPIFVNSVEVAQLPILSAQGAAGLRLGR